MGWCLTLKATNISGANAPGWVLRLVDALRALGHRHTDYTDFNGFHGLT